MRTLGQFAVVGILGASACLVVGSAAPARAAQPPAEGLLELGLVHVHAGDLRRAESLFVAQLSRSPRDARALSNLGNIALLGGDRDGALSFYDLAIVADSADAELRINRAITLALLGEAAESRSEAAEAHRLAVNEAREAQRRALPPAAIRPDSGRVRVLPATPTRTAGALAGLTPAEVQARIGEAVAALRSLEPSSRSLARRPTRSPGAVLRAAPPDDPRLHLFWKK